MSKELTIYFDPGCPWTYRVSLLMRQVAQLRPLTLHWDLVSLAALNGNGKKLAEMGDFWGGKALRLLALVKQQHGDEAVDRLYLAIATAVHEDKKDINDPATLEAALATAEMDKGLLAQALADQATLEYVQQSHDHIMSLKAVGSPSLILKDGDKSTPPFYGPVIDSVPVGEDAAELWDTLEKLMWRPEFFELKRNR